MPSPVSRRCFSTALAAWLVAAAPCSAEVQVLVGSPAGRTTKEPDPTLVNEPFAIAFDRDGRMYGVEYTRGNRLFRITPAAEKHAAVEFVAGTFHVSSNGDQFPPDTATHLKKVQFHGLHDVAVGPDGTVYVADTFRHRIQAFDPERNTVRPVAGTGVAGFSGDGGPAATAAFNQAYCSSLTADGKSLLVADIKNARLRRIDLASGTVTTVAGNGQSGKPIDGAQATETPLAGPRAACQAKDGTIYLALREGNALIEIKDGTIRTVVNESGKAGYAGDGGPGRDALLAGPKYVSLDCEGRVLIADTENHCIRRYDPANGRIELVAGMPPRGGTTVGPDLLSTQLMRPHGACLDPAGRLVIADSDNDRILVGVPPQSRAAVPIAPPPAGTGNSPD
jgi:DNA-binding beta-propeller fold protein YncE